MEVVGFGPVPAAFVRDRLRLGTERDRQCANGHLVDPDPPPTATDPDTTKAREGAAVLAAPAVPVP